jgi:anaerobic dimethyl sulfoxide reductase subunit C
MNVHDLALIAFTILAQMAVGAFLILGGVHYFATRRHGPEEADKLSDRALLAIGPVLVLGMLASLFHLGNPLNAPRALSNLGSSWLSWEILFGVVFAVLGAVFAFMQWRKIATTTVRKAIALVAAVVGVALVFAMSRIYMLPTVPAWNTVATPITFFTTTFLLGALAMGAAFVTNYYYLRRKEADENKVQLSMLATTLRWIAVISIVLLGVHFVVIPLYLAHLMSSTSPAATASASLLMQENGLLLAARLLLVFLGAGVFSLFIYQTATTNGRVQVMGNLALLAFVAVLVAEVLGRYLFYASFVRIGL